MPFFFTEPFIWTLSKISFRNILHEARFMLYEAFSIAIDINLGACIQDQIEKKKCTTAFGNRNAFSFGEALTRHALRNNYPLLLQNNGVWFAGNSLLFTVNTYS